MAFGFAIGDFIAVGDLAWRLYRDCYKIARGAPQEFQLLLGEISTLSNSLNILQEEVKDPTSTLVQAGEDRVRMVNEMVSRIGETLRQLEKVAKKYEILGSGSKRRQILAKFKWSVEFSQIDALRNKLIYHNTVMNLLLTTVGNSSLQRIQSSTAALENDVKAIKGFIARHQFTEVSDKKASEGTEMKPVTPSVSAVDDELFRTSLSAALMKSAEATQPWSTIGVDQWIESGRWWLLRAQMELYAVTVPQQKVPLAAYTNLIKASWILVDIVACHPQVPFIKASTHSEVQLLSAELKNEFSRLSDLQSLFPDLSELEGQDLQIWETQARGPLLQPHKDSRRPDEWTVDGGEQVLFQRFALCKLQVLTESLPCILLFLVSEGGQSARIVIQNQNGAIMMAVSFQTPVQILESDSSVSIKDEKIAFNTIQDAQHFGCLVEATNFYYFGRRAKHASVENLKAYVLITAVKNQKTDVIQRLLQRTILNENAFESESDGGPVAVASTLASQRIANQLKETSESGLQGSTRSLFSWAVQCGLAPLVKVLLIEHPTTDKKGWHGMTPLGFASSCGYEPVVRLLIGSGTDVQATDSSGWAALDHACSKGHEGVARLLLRSGAEVGRTTNPYKSSALHFAARNGHVNVVQLLIDSGADIEAQDYKGFTPLCRVCKAPSLYHETIIALLLDKGANVNRRNEYNMNAMHYALESQMSESAVQAILAKQLERRDNIRDDAGLRREKAIIKLDTDRASFYLDSPNAVIEMPTDTPSNVKCAYNRAIYITTPSGSDEWSPFEFEFMIVHNENALDFSVGHTTSNISVSGRWPRIKIGNVWHMVDSSRSKGLKGGLLMFSRVELGESLVELGKSLVVRPGSIKVQKLKWGNSGRGMIGRR